jgi:hypothetical protein
VRGPSIVFLPLLLIACKGGIHEKGDRMWSVRGQYSHASPGNAGLITTHGHVDSVGVGAYNHWFVADRLALGLGASALRLEEEGRTIWGAEFEAGLRWYFVEIGKTGFFFDLNGGFMLTDKDVPKFGTQGNLLYDFGLGIEVPLGGKSKLLGGVQALHFSNGKGLDSPDNPSQNQIRIWIAYGHDW